MALLQNPFNLLRTLLAVVSCVTNAMQAATVIAARAVLSTVLRFWEEAKSNQAAEALNAMARNTATVVRRDVSEAADESPKKNMDVAR